MVNPTRTQQPFESWQCVCGLIPHFRSLKQCFARSKRSVPKSNSNSCSFLRTCVLFQRSVIFPKNRCVLICRLREHFTRQLRGETHFLLGVLSQLGRKWSGQVNPGESYQPFRVSSIKSKWIMMGDIWKYREGQIRFYRGRVDCTKLSPRDQSGREFAWLKKITSCMFICVHSLYVICLFQFKFMQSSVIW